MMFRFICYSVLLFASVLEAKTGLQGPTHGKVVVCYVASWAHYRQGEGKFMIQDLDPALCTHLVYSFAGLDETSSNIKSLDTSKDIVDNGYKNIVALKNEYPHLKVTLAIGGWNEGSVKYSAMAADPEKRKKFINSVVNYLGMFGFDGLDLDWEYPGGRGGANEDKENFIILVKELKESFEKKGYILTAALGVGKSIMEAAYDLPKLSKYLDFLHLMCYDYHGAWDNIVGANAPLKGKDENDFKNVESTIKYMLDHGVSPYKMVLGLPMYGRTFVLSNNNEQEVVFGKTPAIDKGFEGPFTQEKGFMGYNEICLELKNNPSEWTELWDNTSSTPYLRNGMKVISYDNLRSIANKIKMAIDYDFGGLMVWSIDTDDFRGDCHVSDNGYIDYQPRVQKLNRDPILKKLLKKLNLKNKSNVPAFIETEGELNLYVPQSVSNVKKYPIMRLINEATEVAIQERRIEREIARLEKENEVDIDVRTGSSSRNIGSYIFIGVLFSLYWI